MKIAIMLGRGIEGCGVTKNAVEFIRYKPDAKIFAITDKVWPRGKSMPFPRHEFKAAIDTEVDAVMKEINENFDALIVYSVPSLSHPDEVVTNFIRMMKGITIPKTMVQVDHNNMSIMRNAKLDEVVNSLDLVLTHSMKGAFVAWHEKNNLTTPVDTMGVGFNYDQHRAKWWKPKEAQDSHAVKWIGRCALWKGPILLIDFHNNYLRKHGFMTSLEGLEASIQSFMMTHVDGGKQGHVPVVERDVIHYLRKRHKQAPEGLAAMKHGEAPYLFPEYKNEECMERMSLSGFGSDLYNLKPEYYGNNIEYCHAEVIASGTVPLFHKHFGDHITHAKTGDPASKGFSGTVWLDPANPQPAADIMVELANDPVKRDEWREASFEFWKAHSDSSHVYDDIINKALKAKTLTRVKTVTTLDDFF